MPDPVLQTQSGRERTNSTRTFQRAMPTLRRDNVLPEMDFRPVLPMVGMHRTQQQTDERERQQAASENSETAQETAESEKIPMTEYIRLCNDVKNDAILKIKNPIQELLLQDKREQKRNGPALLQEVGVIRQDLRQRMAQLQDMEVKGDVTTKNMLFKNVVATMIQTDLQIDSLKKSSGEAQVDANHYLSLLKGRYPVTHPLYTLTKAFGNMPETVPPKPKQAEGMDVIGTIKEMGDDAVGLMSSSKDVAGKHAKVHGMKKLEDSIDKVGWLDGVANVLGMISSAYAMIKQFTSKKETTDEDVGEFIDNFGTFLQSLFGALDSFGLKQFEEVVPIVGAVFAAISALVNGFNTIRELSKALDARSSMKKAKRGLEERLVRNRDKEQALGHTQPTLQTMTKRKGRLLKKYEGVSAQTVAQQRAAFRNGFGNENIYKKKVELKQQRAGLLAKRQRTDAENLQLDQLDQQIGQLRMAQDIQRLGVTDEAKSKQSKKAITASTNLVKIAIDLAAAIAGVFPGIGELVSAGLSLGKGMAEVSAKAIKWIYKQTKRYERHQQKKQLRRGGLADTVIERLGMLSSPEYQLPTLYAAGAQPNPYVVKATYKEYDALEMDLQRGMGAAPEVLATAESRELLKNRLIIAFSQEE